MVRLLRHDPPLADDERQDGEKGCADAHADRVLGNGMDTREPLHRHADLGDHDGAAHERGERHEWDVERELLDEDLDHAGKRDECAREGHPAEPLDTVRDGQPERQQRDECERELTGPCAGMDQSEVDQTRRRARS